MRATFSIPPLRGRAADRLSRAEPRVTDSDEGLAFPEAVGDLLVRSADERGAVALACLVLEHVREHGGGRISKRALDGVLRRALQSFGPKEVMDIEVEAYEIFQWLGQSLDPQWDQAPPKVGAGEQGAARLELLQWAIEAGHDLEVDYYSRGRGELTHRRIRPLRLEAETYLHAYCHLRHDERVFRLTRMAEVRPVGGWSAYNRRHVPARAPAAPRTQAPSDSQASLLPLAEGPAPAPPSREARTEPGQMSLLETSSRK